MPKPTTCKIESCGGRVRAIELCAKHYERNRKYGDPLGLSAFASRSHLQRFREFIVGGANGCSIWTGSSVRGYGRFSVDGQTVIAHRWIWQQENGPIPEGLVIRHKCDTPSCVKVEHMELGTNAENIGDMIERGRSLIGSTNHESKLDEDKVRQIRLELQRGTTTQKALAQRYDVSTGAISHIAHGRAWRHVKLIEAA